MTKEKWLTHVNLQCTQCKKGWDNMSTAQRLAIEHCKKTGHTVTGDMGYHVGFKSKEKP